MLPISSRPDMNSRATRQRSHRSRIGSRAGVSNRDGLVESADQAAQRRVGHRFIPVVENHVERWFALDRADDGAEDGRPSTAARQGSCRSRCCRSAAKTTRMIIRRTEANQHLGRSHFLRQVRKLRQDWKPSTVRALHGRSVAGHVAASRDIVRSGLTRNCRTDRLVERIRVTRHGGNAWSGSPAR